MKNTDGEIKLSFWEIMFSPFISIKNMITSKNDIDNTIDLNPDSTNKEESDLAKSLEKVDEQVQNYGNSSKAKRRETLNSVKVEKKDLKPVKDKTATKTEKESGNQGREIVD